MYVITADFTNPEKPEVIPGIELKTEDSIPYNKGFIRVGAYKVLVEKEELYPLLANEYKNAVDNFNYLKSLDDSIAESFLPADFLNMLDKDFQELAKFKLYYANYKKAKEKLLVKPPKNSSKVIINLLLQDTPQEQVRCSSSDFNKTLISYKSSSKGNLKSRHIHELEDQDDIFITFKAKDKVLNSNGDYFFNRYGLHWDGSSLHFYHQTVKENKQDSNNETHTSGEKKLVKTYSIDQLVDSQVIKQTQLFNVLQQQADFIKSKI